jgi:F420H(2)-dependent quinone reductase
MNRLFVCVQGFGGVRLARIKERLWPLSTGGMAWYIRGEKDFSMPTTTKQEPSLPPRWFIRSVWQGHRALLRVSGDRLGLWRPKSNKWGALRLITTGRRTGREHSVVVGYFEDGPNLVTLAMNGWGEGEPAWWLNLQAHPDVEVELADGHRSVTGRAAQGIERDRLWRRWGEIDKNLDDYAALRSTETAVVVLEPRSEAEDASVAS